MNVVRAMNIAAIHAAVDSRAPFTFFVLSPISTRRFTLAGLWQQITVKHVTVNADQAVVTDSITTGTAPALQNNSPVAVEQILEPELVRDGRGQKPK
jgi:hypothetical protein